MIMFFYEGSEIIGFLLKTIAILFFSGIIAIPLFPAGIRPVISIFFIINTNGYITPDVLMQHGCKSFYKTSRKILNNKLIEKEEYNAFQFVQNGKIQAYVIYCIVSILAIFIGIILNL